MAKGDHLIVDRGLYHHHGIDCGDGRVVQYGGGVPGEADATVEVVDVEAFARGSTVIAAVEPARYCPNRIVRRALRRLGERRYCLTTNNCEHFVNWCRTGCHHSRQVERVVERVAAAASKVTMHGGVRPLVGPLVHRSATKAVGPWLLLADAAQLGAEVVAARCGAAPRRAERVGRHVGRGVAVTVGAVAGGPAGGAAGLGAWTMGEMVGRRVAAMTRRSESRGR